MFLNARRDCIYKFASVYNLNPSVYNLNPSVYNLNPSVYNLNPISVFT